MNTFGKRLVAAREQRGLSQKELAELLDITPTRLNYWEKDKREPNVEMIRNISSVLKVNSDYLIGNWASDLYDDFSRLKTDDERLAFLNQYGAPVEYAGLYASLSGTREEEISEDELYLLELFRKAAPSDQNAVRLILSKYENEHISYSENKSPLRAAARSGDDLNKEDFSQITLPDDESDTPV